MTPRIITATDFERRIVDVISVEAGEFDTEDF